MSVNTSLIIKDFLSQKSFKSISSINSSYNIFIDFTYMHIYFTIFWGIKSVTCGFNTHKSSYSGKLIWKERSKTGYGRNSHEQSLQVSW